MLVIHETNLHEFGPTGERKLEDGTIVGVRRHCGEDLLLACLPAPIPRGTHPNATPFRLSTLDAGFGAGVTIPQSEWQARIQEIEEQESGVDHHINFQQYTQNGLPYCWTNSSNQAAATKRVIQGHPYVQFSSASVGCPITGYRSVGGWGGDSLKYLAEHGSVDAKLWGNNAIDRSLDTPATQENRKYHKVLEWIEAETWEEQVTLGLMCIPMVWDFNNWSHSTMGCRPVWVDGEAASLGRNSWFPWGDKNKWGVDGFYVRQGRNARADSCFGVREVTAAVI